MIPTGPTEVTEPLGGSSRLGSRRMQRAARLWLPEEERTIGVEVAVNSHTEKHRYTVDIRDAVFVPIRPAVGAPPDNGSASAGSDKIVKLWWGVVDRIDEAAGTFVAELYPEGREQDTVRYSTEFLLTHVPLDERDRLEEGAIFTWETEVDPITGESGSRIRFPAPTFATEEELAEEERSAREWFRERGIGGPPEG